MLRSSLIIRFVAILSLTFSFILASESAKAEDKAVQASPTVIITQQQNEDRIDPELAWSKIKEGALLVDVRSAEEYAGGHIAGSINIPHTEVEKEISKFGADRNREIVLYCRSGKRAGLAQESLKKSGFTHVYNAGGYDDLKSGEMG